MSEKIAFATARYVSNDFPEKDRLPIWREQLARAFLKIDLEPAKDVPFQSRITTCMLGDIGILKTDFTRCRISRKIMADGGDDLSLIVYSSMANIVMNGRELLLQQGEATLLNGSETGRVDRHTGSGFGIRVPRALLCGLVKNVDSRTLQKIPRGTGALSLLTHYVHNLMYEVSLDLPEMRTLAYRHIIDLFAATLGPASDAEEVILSRGIRAARLKAARAFVIQNTQQQLSVAHVATHLCVTPRYVQRMFEFEGTTFSALLLELRLNDVCRMLQDPRYDSSTVEQVARNAGFGDISYFYRSFRQRFGATPGEIRKPSQH
jgi:AraC-like DNA-binding protein